jgi:hypothetical protein
MGKGKGGARLRGVELRGRGDGRGLLGEFGRRIVQRRQVGLDQASEFICHKTPQVGCATVCTSLP